MKILMVGANGYGAKFLEPIYNMHKSGEAVFEGVVTRSPYPLQEEFAAAGIPTYKTLDAFYAEHTADLAVISTPAFLHKEQSIYCVEHGSYVLCEKPAAPTVEEVEAMIQAEKDTGKFIAIGYQRCFSDAIVSLKKDILAGLLGKPVSTKFLSASARALVYYSRGGGYAGQVYTKDGRMILDSPASNACAHYVQEMLFLLGEELDVTAEPTLVSGECYRAIGAKTYLWQAGHKFWYSDRGDGLGTHNTGVIHTRACLDAMGIPPSAHIRDDHGIVGISLEHEVNHV